MTPEDLAAIRARNADPDWTEEAGVAIRDVRALLAEVDRLREDRGYGPDEPGMCECGHDMDAHAGGMVLLHHDTFLRARIHVAVEGLPGESLPVYDDDEGRIALWKDMVDRAAVLAAIDGDA